MKEIELNIQLKNSCADGWRTAERPMKTALKKKVRFAKPETVENCYSTAFKLCKFNPHIKQEIPEMFQSIIYHVYHLCILHNIINVANVFFAILLKKTTFTIAGTFIYFLVSLVFSYLVWFRCAYKAFAVKSKAYFATFLISFFLQFIFSCIQTIGTHNTISTGFLSALEMSSDITSYTNYKMVTEVIVSSLSGCCALSDVLLIVMVFNMYSKIVRFCRIVAPEDEIIKHA